MHAGEYSIPWHHGSRPIDTNREFVVVGWVEFDGDEDEGLFVVVQCHIQLISDFMFMAIYSIYCPPIYVYNYPTNLTPFRGTHETETHPQ